METIGMFAWCFACYGIFKPLEDFPRWDNIILYFVTSVLGNLFLSKLVALIAQAGT